MPWAVQLRNPVISGKNHFSLVELRNTCQSKYIYKIRLISMEFQRVINVRGHCLPDRQCQDVDLDYIKIILCKDGENL